MVAGRSPPPWPERSMVWSVGQRASNPSISGSSDGALNSTDPAISRVETAQLVCSRSCRRGRAIYWLPATCCLLPTTGYSLLATGYWLLATGYWLLAAGYWLLATGYWLLATGYWLLATSYLPQRNERTPAMHRINVLASATTAATATAVGRRRARDPAHSSGCGIGVYGSGMGMGMGMGRNGCRNA